MPHNLKPTKREIDPAIRQTISVLGQLAAFLIERTKSPHPHRFTSYEQARPFYTAAYQWEKAGRTGTKPTATPAIIRAATYDLAQQAVRLSTFASVSSVASLEFVQSAASALGSGQLIVPLALLRCFIERVALAASLADELKDLPNAAWPDEAPLKPIWDVSEKISQSLYGTSRDWVSLTKVDFRNTSPKEAAYSPKEDVMNLKVGNILNSVDRLNKRVRGTRFVYEILCEFLHPNVGDLMGATIQGASTTDDHGTRHLLRMIGNGPKDLSGTPDQQAVIAKLLDIVGDIARDYPQILKEIDVLADFATKKTRKVIHKMIARDRDLFGSKDLCPCLSGLNVKKCKQSSRFRR